MICACYAHNPTGWPHLTAIKSNDTGTPTVNKNGQWSNYATTRKYMMVYAEKNKHTTMGKCTHTTSVVKIMAEGYTDKNMLRACVLQIHIQFPHKRRKGCALTDKTYSEDLSSHLWISLPLLCICALIKEYVIMHRYLQWNTVYILKSEKFNGCRQDKDPLPPPPPPVISHNKVINTLPSLNKWV